ncbi:NUDIX hydrolase [Candidatus Thorarchaeota archaeon]|nr:MAG: NUDIX hydrolase [Candidatus Thorarchaeota archaeon]
MHRNPVPTVDVIIYDQERIALIRRGQKPFKGQWALPGGFVEYGETVEEAAVRETREETNLDVRLVDVLGVYSAPDRDPRKHTISTVFVAEAVGGELMGGDDAADAAWLPLKSLDPSSLAFDHSTIVRDMIAWTDRRRAFWSTKERN